MAHEAGLGGGGVSDALGATVGSLGNAIGATIIGAFVVWLACGFTMALSLLGLTSSVSPRRPSLRLRSGKKRLEGGASFAARERGAEGLDLFGHLRLQRRRVAAHEAARGQKG